MKGTWRCWDAGKALSCSNQLRYSSLQNSKAQLLPTGWGSWTIQGCSANLPSLHLFLSTLPFSRKNPPSSHFGTWWQIQNIFEMFSGKLTLITWLVLTFWWQNRDAPPNLDASPQQATPSGPAEATIQIHHQWESKSKKAATTDLENLMCIDIFSIHINMMYI